MSMLNGAMAGLGGSMQTVGKTMMDADIDEAKQARLAKIQQESQGREFAQRNKETQTRIDAENKQVHSTDVVVGDDGSPRKVALLKGGDTKDLGGASDKDVTGRSGGSVPKGTRANPIMTDESVTVTDKFGEQKIMKMPIRTFIEGGFEYQEKYDSKTGKWITSQKIPLGDETKPPKNPFDAMANDIITGGNSSGQFSGKGLLKKGGAEQKATPVAQGFDDWAKRAAAANSGIDLSNPEHLKKLRAMFEAKQK